MARSIVYRPIATSIEDKPFLALAKYLSDGSKLERVSGGAWVRADDAKALATMRDVALEFAQLCDSAIGKLAAPAPAKKAPAKAPTPPAQKASTKTGKLEAAPPPKVSNPAPAKAPAAPATGLDDMSWLDLVRS